MPHRPSMLLVHVQLLVLTFVLPRLPADDILPADECEDESDESDASCGLVALQMRGKKLVAAAADDVQEAEGMEQPYICMYYPWLPRCQQGQMPKSYYAPQYSPMSYVPQPSYNPMPQYNPASYFPAPAPRYNPPPPSPPPYYNPAVPSSLRVTRRGGLDPPASVTTHNGASWETMRVPGTELKHIFAVGDWGSLLGTGPKRLIQYAGGQTPGPHTMARHRGGGCSTKGMTGCMGGSPSCPRECHFKPEVDMHAQTLVAAQMKKRAPQSNPDFILNVGDNFYWGGIETECGHPMSQIHPQTQAQFAGIFEGVYSGKGLEGKPWLSVFGNHDLGGYQFNKAWDQQIAYTFASDRWRLPALYWMQRVEYTDQDFAAEFLMIDSNAFDVKPLDADPEHNICGRLHTPPGASCARTGGPSDLKACFKWFWDLWNEQMKWVEKKLLASNADWQIVVTHFPCGTHAKWFKKLHQQFGLDLLVTGHTHAQMVFHKSGLLGGMTCFITGGGGGIVSEGDATPFKSSQYGFFDMTISKQKINLESINHNGWTVGKWDVFPVGPSQD